MWIGPRAGRPACSCPSSTRSAHRRFQLRLNAKLLQVYQPAEMATVALSKPIWGVLIAALIVTRACRRGSSSPPPWSPRASVHDLALVLFRISLHSKHAFSPPSAFLENKTGDAPSKTRESRRHTMVPELGGQMNHEEDRRSRTPWRSFARLVAPAFAAGGHGGCMAAGAVAGMAGCRWLGMVAAAMDGVVAAGTAGGAPGR